MELAPNQLFVKRLLYGASIGGLTLLLSAFWVGPFLFNHDYMTDMKYGFKPDGGSESFWSMLFDQEPFLDVLINTLAIIGLIAAIARRHVYGVALGLTGLIAVAMVYLTRDSLPVIGLLWNPRMLPWVYLMRYLMMMVGAVEVAGVLINWIRNRPAREVPGVGTRSLIAGAIGLVVLVIFGFVFQMLPGGSKIGDQYAWGPIRSGPRDARRAQRRLAGVQLPRLRVQAAVPRVPRPRADDERPRRPRRRRRLRAGAVGDRQPRRCGQRQVRHDDGADAAAVLDRRLHRLDGGAVLRGVRHHAVPLPHRRGDVGQRLEPGAPAALHEQRRRRRRPAHPRPRHPLRDGHDRRGCRRGGRPGRSWTPVATSGPWHIYEYVDAAIVEPLDVQPVVVNGRDGDQRECFLEVGTSWFQHGDEWAAMPAVDGPDTWQRIDVAIDASRQEPQGQGTDECGDPQSSTSRRVNIVTPAQEIDVVELPEVEVSNVDVGEQSVEFDVSEPGVPVLVRVSYFPNWTADGAEGPYRIGPNQMVVVPTDTHVRLAYERSNTDMFFYGLTVLGIVLALFARFRGDWNFPKLVRRRAARRCLRRHRAGRRRRAGRPGFDAVEWVPQPQLARSQRRRQHRLRRRRRRWRRRSLRRRRTPTIERVTG